MADKENKLVSHPVIFEGVKENSVVSTRVVAKLPPNFTDLIKNDKSRFPLKVFFQFAPLNEEHSIVDGVAKVTFKNLSNNSYEFSKNIPIIYDGKNFMFKGTDNIFFEKGVSKPKEYKLEIGLSGIVVNLEKQKVHNIAFKLPTYFISVGPDNINSIEPKEKEEKQRKDADTEIKPEKIVKLTWNGKAK